MHVACGAGVNMGLARGVEGAGMTHPPRHGVVHADATSSDENGGAYVFLLVRCMSASFKAHGVAGYVLVASACTHDLPASTILLHGLPSSMILQPKVHKRIWTGAFAHFSWCMRLAFVLKRS